MATASAKPAPKKTAAAKPAPKPKAEKAPKPKVERDIQNDVTRPKSDSKTGRIWAIADEISKSKKAPATRAEVMEKAVAEDINEATVATQYQRWRVYNGVERAPKAEKPAKAPKVKKAA